MTLLVTVFAAIISSIIWYQKSPNDSYKVVTLCYLYWGASLMWFVDAVFVYIEDSYAFFHPAPADMLNDLFLGLSAVALGLIFWLVVVMIKDPKGIIRKK